MNYTPGQSHALTYARAALAHADEAPRDPAGDAAERLMLSTALAQLLAEFPGERGRQQ